MRITATFLALLPGMALAGGKNGGKCKKPLVSSQKLQSLVTIDDLLDGSKKLQEFAYANGGNRAFGGGGHNATVDWVYKTLKSLNYYNVVKQPFESIYSEASGTLTIGGEDIQMQPMTYTPAGDVSAPLVPVANLGCEVEDYPAEVAGKIALISRGSCTFSQKSQNAKAAGAVGALVYNNEEGLVQGTLGEALLDYAPIAGITQADGLALLEKLAEGEVVADLKIDATVENRITYNVIAETKGGDHENVLVVGAHSDSVPAGPGINDDGSGTVGILTVAKALAKFRVKNAVRFCWWSAEEFGLLGSEFYVNSINGSQAELAKIRAYLNFDMIASPNYIYGIYDGDGNAFNLTGPVGSDLIEKNFENFFKAKNTPSVPTEFSGRSDYAAFIENGIPSGGLFTGAEVLKTEEEAALFGGEAGVAYDKNYHQPGDTVDNLALDAFLLNTQSIADAVATYALSWEGFPEVNLNQRRWDAERSKNIRRSGGSHGHGPRSGGHSHAHGVAHSGPCGGGDRA